MASTLDAYLSRGPAAESNLRSVVLFGRNTASYKFALAESIMDLAREGRDSVSLEELAVPYATHMVEHARVVPKQSTSRSNRFTKACVDYARGEATREELLGETLRSGFTYVLDAFHKVNQVEVPVRLFEKDFSRGSRRVVLTDAAMSLAASSQAGNILSETEARWRLVEEAWQTGVSANLLALEYDGSTGLLTTGVENRRRSVTSVRGALDGYQKGHCFYCYARIRADGRASADADGAPPCDVDHFLPHALGRVMPHANLDGVWNLVLACPECNRGVGGKSSRMPDMGYLGRLHRRNEWLVTSHHPLREAIIRQTGGTPESRLAFLVKAYGLAEVALPGAKWSAEPREEATF